MNTLFRTLLSSSQIFIGVVLSWQGMNEAYKFNEADYLQALLSLTSGFIMIFVGVLGIMTTKKH